MHNVLLCVLMVLLILWLVKLNMSRSEYLYKPCGRGYGFATDTNGSGNLNNMSDNPQASSMAAQMASSKSVVKSPSENKDVIAANNYNDFLKSAALEPTIKEQHKEWINTLNINLQPRMYSIRDDCDDGETPRWGLLKKDYSNVINEKQNISIPSGRICAEGDGGNSRWGGYGIGLCPVQRTP